MPLLEFTSSGIYCPAGDFFIDPWKPVKCAIITHAHSDHARWGMEHYISHHLSVVIMKYRLGEDISVMGYDYGETFSINGVKISLHPAGHIIGSSQVRVEYKGEVWVAAGDYKLEHDGVSTPFEPVKCHTFITESTFGLPVFKWTAQQEIFEEMNTLWRQNKELGKATVIIGYSLGKAQRILKNLDDSIGPVYTHGAVENINEILRLHHIDIMPTIRVTPEMTKEIFRGALIIAPPSALGTPWLRKFGPYTIGVASGWMGLRGARRWRAVDRGFVLSDHADWKDLNIAIKETAAEKVYVTHGYTAVFAKWLNDNGIEAYEGHTHFEVEDEK